MRKVNMEQYLDASNRYVLKAGSEDGAPPCPFGNQYKWLGYDTKEKEFIRFTKSVFKLLINQDKT